MRPAVLAAAVAFDPRLAWTRAPIRAIARLAAPAVMRWLDRRRRRLDGVE